MWPHLKSCRDWSKSRSLLLASLLTGMKETGNYRSKILFNQLPASFPVQFRGTENYE